MWLKIYVNMSNTDKFICSKFTWIRSVLVLCVFCRHSSKVVGFVSGSSYCMIVARDLLFHINVVLQAATYCIVNLNILVKNSLLHFRRPEKLSNTCLICSSSKHKGHKHWHRSESNENVKTAQRINTLLCTTVGTAGHQCGFSMYCVWRPYCVQL